MSQDKIDKAVDKMADAAQDVSQTLNTPIGTGTDTPLSIASRWAATPVPAWAFAGGLLASPLMRPRLMQSASSALLKGVAGYPSNVHVGVFSAFTALGGFLIYDNDLKDGAAVSAVWSLLYVMSNGKKSLMNLKLYPKGLTSLALVNTLLYGGKYLNVI